MCFPEAANIMVANLTVGFVGYLFALNAKQFSKHKITIKSDTYALLRYLFLTREILIQKHWIGKKFTK